MTTVVIPLVRSAGAVIVPAAVTVTLTDDRGQPLLGFTGADLVGTYRDLALDQDPIALDLIPQTQIARADGQATWYRVDLRTRYAHQTYLVQVPDVAFPVDLADLVAATTVASPALLDALMAPYLAARDAALAALADTEALLASQDDRLLPDPAALPDGSLVQVLDGQWVVL